jgi:hypothetical protein
LTHSRGIFIFKLALEAIKNSTPKSPIQFCFSKAQPGSISTDSIEKIKPFARKGLVKENNKCKLR